MKKVRILLLLLLIPMVQYGQIVADHTVVDQFDDIPQQYIDIVKTMLVCMAGESHSMGYQNGQLLLEQLDPTYQVETYTTDPPPAYSDQYLRIGRPYMMGEDSFFSPSGLDNLKQAVADQNDTGNPFDVMGFVWCWDMTWENPPGGTMDPVYRVRWAGSSEGSPDGNKRWGLDRGDSILTGNRVNMDTYLEGVDEVIRYCKDMGIPTQWIYNTGPVDGEEENGSEMGFQRELKHDHIRAWVAADASRILFDYADILCWNNDGEKNMAEWNDNGEIRPHAQIHPDNLMDYDESFNIIDMVNDTDGDHIGEVGALRLAKAMWWMLARIAGWEGTGTVSVPVSVIEVTGEGGATTIEEPGGTLQLSASVIPSNATDKTVTWSVINGTGEASISNSGLLTAVSDGTVAVRATANDGSSVYGEVEVTISQQGNSAGMQLGEEEPFTIRSGRDLLEVRFQEDHGFDRIFLCNLMGQIVHEERVTGNSCQFGTGTLPPGLYLVVAVSESKNYRSVKLFKSNE